MTNMNPRFRDLFQKFKDPNGMEPLAQSLDNPEVQNARELQMRSDMVQDELDAPRSNPNYFPTTQVPTQDFQNNQDQQSLQNKIMDQQRFEQLKKLLNNKSEI